MKRSKTIWIAVGGSGGHLFPAQVCAAEMQSTLPQFHIVFVGEGLAKNPFFDRKFPCVDVSSGTLTKKTFWKLPIFGFKLIKGIIQTAKLFQKQRPDFMIGFGSFHSLPPLCIAWWFNIPFVLFEPNSIMGRVNRFFSNKATKLFHGVFPLEGVASEPVSMPLDITRLHQLPKNEAKRRYGLDPTLPVILIFGGSQGAKTMNLLAVEALEHVKKRCNTIQVLHLIGPNTDKKWIENRYQAVSIPACVLEFETQMQWAYSAADLALARSGASAVAELLAHQIPSIFMPYPFVEEDHQRKNAQSVQTLYQFGHIVDQNSVSVSHLTSKFIEVLESLDLQTSSYRDLASNKVTLAEAVAKILTQGSVV